jgi:hypothetical protein
MGGDGRGTWLTWLILLAKKGAMSNDRVDCLKSEAIDCPTHTFAVPSSYPGICLCPK